MNVYTSDPHFGHTNIVQYTHRAFASVSEMDLTILTNWRAAVGLGHKIHCLGDVSFNLRKVITNYGWVERPEDMVLIAGNHDQVRKQKAVYEAAFGTVVGTEKTWQENSLIIEDDGAKLLLSHAPQLDLQGCDYNLFGHIHNSLIVGKGKGHHPEYDWTWESPQHINTCVELFHYYPVGLDMAILTNAYNRWGDDLAVIIAD